MIFIGLSSYFAVSGLYFIQNLKLAQRFYFLGNISSCLLALALAKQYHVDLNDQGFRAEKQHLDVPLHRPTSETLEVSRNIGPFNFIRPTLNNLSELFPIPATTEDL